MNPSQPDSIPGDSAPGQPVSVAVAALWIYPVKSCAGIRCPDAEVTVRGLAHDREWMVVGPDGRFLTQRQHPRLALIRVELGRDGLCLRAEGMEACRVPWEPRERQVRTITVWQHTGPAWDEGPEPARWLSRFLGSPAALVRFMPDERRLSSREWTGEIEAENRFTDGFPILVLSEESVADLNRRIGSGVYGIERFRPNVVLRGGGPYLEDRVGRLTAEGMVLRLVKPCVRCRIITTDQATAEVGVEPLRTLATYRRHERLGGVVFGVNALLASAGPARLREGMVLRAA